MSKAVWAGIILLAILAATLYNIRYLDKLTGELLSLTETAQERAEAGDFQGAVSEAEQAARLWAEKDGYTHVLIRHSEIDSTTDAFYELLSDLHAQDALSARGSFEKLRAHLTSIASMEHITFGSIF